MTGRRQSDYDRVYRFIVEYKLAHDGTSPSSHDIGAGCKVRSKSHLSYILDTLEREGKIRKNFAIYRSIEVVGGRWVPPGA